MTQVISKGDLTVWIGRLSEEHKLVALVNEAGITIRDDPSNVDILLVELADCYIVQAVTEKGKAILPQDLLKESETTPSDPFSPFYCLYGRHRGCDVAGL